MHQRINARKSYGEYFGVYIKVNNSDNGGTKKKKQEVK